MTTGDTFFFNGAFSHHHLWIVTGGPTPGNEFAIFNVTTIVPGCDQTCVLNVTDHPLITHPSYVTYLHGRSLPGAVVTKQAHLISMQAALKPTVLLRVQQGALASCFTTQNLQEIVRKYP